MKIDLATIDQSDFNVVPHRLKNNEIVYLVNPKFFPSWQEHTIYFRSSVWSENGDLVSAGFPKFFNWGEKPDLHPVPTSLRNCELIEKLDGSLLSVTRFKGEWIIRTRGTVNAAESLDNGLEIEYLMQKYPKVFDESTVSTWNHSLLFEWVTPNNKIILNYGDDPFLYLIGCVMHEDYSLMSQEHLDGLGDRFNVKRPKRFNFNSVEELLQAVEGLKGQEGICVYSRNGQRIDKVVNLFFTLGKPTYNEFYSFIETQFDYELAEYCRGSISKIVDANKEVKKIVDYMHVFLNQNVKHLPSRKEQALKILESYGKTNRSSFMFHLLDGNEKLTDEQEKKILFQVLATLR
jgi:hypothetical protein